MTDVIGMSTIFSNYLDEFFKNNLSYCEAQCERRSSYGNECCFCNIYESIFFNCSEATYATASLINKFITTPDPGDILTYNEYVACKQEYKKMENKFKAFVNKNAKRYLLKVKFEEDGILLYKEKELVGIIKEFESLSDLTDQICKIYQKI